MCGIAGQVSADERPVDRQLIAKMGECLRHRGPDDSGLYVSGRFGFAHRRLSVLDVTMAGQQPMWNERKTVCIVFNGEIYNFEELRANLKSHHSLRSRTDTEVLLYLYEDYGLQCVSMLRGMFAFAIWDEKANRLVLARDRLGEKPLFYWRTDQGLFFASELKALLINGCSPDIDPIAIHHYLTFQYIPAPLTIFRGIRKLQPGHLLVYEDGKLSENAYWSLRYDNKLVLRSENEYREEFFALLKESIRLRLISDVPLGAFLSGGVDSSSIVAMMSELGQGPVKTFSVGFKEEAYNELPYAREVARRFGTDHREIIIEPSVIEILPALVYVYDEPYADSSAIPTYYIAKFSREWVTVVLSGDGGDEILAGYPRYQFTYFDRLAARFPPPGNRKQFSKFLGGILHDLPWGASMKASRLRSFKSFSQIYLGRICYFSPAEKAQLYNPDFRAQVGNKDSDELLISWFEDAQASELLNQLLAVDTRSYLPDDLLVKLDRATMAHGLEARSPFLDHKLVEFAASLPIHLKVREGNGKYLLKSAMRGLLPDHILDRPKQGFGVPIDRWFRCECHAFLRDTLLSSRSVGRGYFQEAY
ncbi:MAG: asparagine synthase (glutamine-hydrolyzing), partial [Nitrospiraceae bacterium]